MFFFFAFYFRNDSAETLYGWKENEIIGQRVADFLVAEEYYTSLQKILQQLITGVPWSGQFPFKKRSGEIFMAMVTKTPFYEGGELIGVITVSSDASVFNSKDFDDRRTCQSCAKNQPGIQSFKRIQWPPRPQIASSVTNMVLTSFITATFDIFLSSLFFSILIEK